jgi:ABC-type transporter Mla MlaB component
LDPATLAAAAIAAALPYVVALGKEAAKGAAGAAGKSVWEWVKGKLTSAAGQEAVKDLEKAPDDADNRKAAEAALSKLLKVDSGALSELAQLLEKAGVTSTTLTANVVGNENIVGQISGSGNTVSINRGPTPPVKPSKAS